MSERYLGTHRPAPARRPGLFSRTRRRLRDLTIGVVAGSLLGGGAAVALSAGDTIGCQPGQVIILDPSGTWACSDRPAPAPSATLSPSASPSTSATPSPSVSPTATTAPPTTPPAPSPSPTPSPTGPPALLRNCFGDVKNSAGVIDQARLAACGYPTLASTGVPAGTVLTPWTGSSVISTAGTVIDGKTLGCIQIRALNVVIRNSRITCTGTAIYAADAPSASGTGNNIRLERVEISCTNGTGHGVWAHNVTATAVQVRDCENAFELNANSIVQDSYLSAREGTSAAHGDVIQSQGGSDVQVIHNSFVGLNPITSSIITNPTQNLRWTVSRNFLSAGAFVLYCSDSGSGAWIVSENRFYAPVGNWTSDPHRPAYGFVDGCSGVGTWTSNYRDDTLAIVGRSG